jgi:hypothetical protein
MHISTNGYVTFGPGHYAHGNSLPIPTPGGAIGGVKLDGIIGMFWADLDPGATGAASDSGIYYSGDSETVTVTYNKINIQGNDKDCTFQGIFFPTGEFHLQYKEVPSGQCADDDACLQGRPYWGSWYTCAGSSHYCSSYPADMACCPDTCSLCGTQKPSIGYENHDGTLGEQLAYGWEDSALSGGVNFAFLVSPSFLPAFDEQVPFKAMPGCSGGYEMILDLALCNAAKAVLQPTFTGVNDGGFGSEWSNGCFFNGNTVYFHAVGADHGGYDAHGGFSATHQTMCVAKSPLLDAVGKYVVPADAPEGSPSFSISFADTSGNIGVTVTATTDGSDVAIDLTPPTISAVSIANADGSDMARDGDTIVVMLTASEPISSPTVTIAGQLVSDSTSTDSTTWAASLTVSSAIVSEGNVVFVVQCQDLAGNPAGVDIVAATDSSSVTVDLTKPTLLSITMASNNNDGSKARAGDYITVAIESSEPHAAPTVLIAGQTAAVSVDTNNAHKFSAELLVTNGAAEGAASLVVHFEDYAGNSGDSVTQTTDGSSVTIDLTAPTLTAAWISSNRPGNPAVAIAGDDITVSVVSTELLLMPSVTIAGQTATVTAGLTASAWEGTYHVDAADQVEGLAAVSITYKDTAGNPGTPLTAVTDGSSVETDLTPPTLLSVTIASNNAINNVAEIDDKITVLIESSEPLGAAPTVTISGQQATLWADPYFNMQKFEATYVVVNGLLSSVVAGVASVDIIFGDVAGNLGTTVTQMTDGSSVVIDLTPPCDSSPCGGGGICTDQGGSFVCTCSAAAYGGGGLNTPCYPVSCSITPCSIVTGSGAEKTVLPTGTCAETGANSLVACTCDAGYSGITCAEDIDACQADTCSGRGTCTDGVGSASPPFTCACDEGWGGGTCKQTSLPPDCAGVPCDATKTDHQCATVDDCGFCSGGSTGLARGASCRDCSGTKDGSAGLDRCGHCAGGTTGQTACEADCAGVFGGSKVNDACQVCGGDGSSCDGSCPKSWEDMCGVCDLDTSNDCRQDCAGNWAAGNTPQTGLDQCGICGGANACLDCNGDVKGSARLSEKDTKLAQKLGQLQPVIAVFPQ